MIGLARLALVAAVVAPVAAVATIAHADDDIDVDKVEILDVVDTSDGSSWKGVIIEFVPGASITIALSGGSIHVIPLSDVVRISRHKNPRRVARSHQPRAKHPGPVAPSQPAPARRGLPAPFATSGRRLGVGLLVAFPTGAWGAQQSSAAISFAPSIQLGFERRYGRVAFSGGGRVTWLYFLDDTESKDAFWTLETHGYLRSTVHVGEVAVYAGVSLGLDTNFSYFNSVRHRYLRVGPGLTIEGGADIALTARVALGLAGVFYPGTTAAAAPDAVPSDAAPDVSYGGLRVGTTVRF